MILRARGLLQVARQRVRGEQAGSEPQTDSRCHVPTCLTGAVRSVPEYLQVQRARRADRSDLSQRFFVVPRADTCCSERRSINPGDDHILMTMW